MAVPHGFLEVGICIYGITNQRCFYRLLKVIDSILLFCNSHKNESSDISLWISLTSNDTVIAAEASTPNSGFLLLDFQGSCHYDPMSYG